MDWPIASVLLGSLGTVAVAIAKWSPRRPAGPPFASLVEMAEIRARLDGLERAHHVMRSEVRSDIKELEQAIRSWMGRE